MSVCVCVTDQMLSMLVQLATEIFALNDCTRMSVGAKCVKKLWVSIVISLGRG